LHDGPNSSQPHLTGILRRTRTALATFLETEESGGIILFVAAVGGMVWANLLPGYDTFWHESITVGGLEKDLRHWVNDGLMTVFFLVVGLEIKRELVVGELREPRVAMLPAAAALGGMVAPALVYLAINANGGAMSGWAIPMATDIAFVVGALAVLGPRVPSGLKLFLLTLAIVDDVGAIVVIALVYSRGIAWRWLLVSVAALAVVALMSLIRISSPLTYLVPGIAAWAAMVSSGIHPTLSGVALGLMVPARPVRGRPVLEDLERWLHPVSSYAIIPIFALANAGVVLTAESLRGSIASRVFWGVALGLVIGKTAGIAGASFVAERLRIGRRPEGASMRHITGGAAMAGIGFTVSLFIAGLAFESGVFADQARMGILVGSIASAVAGGFVLGRGRRADILSDDARAGDDE
jgi:Na+:H+ antiporter, NhaA family